MNNMLDSTIEQLKPNQQAPKTSGEFSAAIEEPVDNTESTEPKSGSDATEQVSAPIQEVVPDEGTSAPIIEEVKAETPISIGYDTNSLPGAIVQAKASGEPIPSGV
ncbi:MAG: hypothetical protein AB9915_01900 [Candidatus Dojkabacteria bacterium]